MRNKIIIIGTGNMCSRIYIQLLFDDSNAFFRLHFYAIFPFVVFHLSLLLGVRCSKKIISFVIPFLLLFTLSCIGLWIAFFHPFTFSLSSPSFIYHVRVYLSLCLIFLFYFHLLDSVTSSNLLYTMHLHCHGHHLLSCIAFLACLLQGYLHNDSS